MSLGNSDLDRFLCRVHRRWVALRLLEQMGVGMAIGGGGMLLFMPFLIWYGQATLPLALLMLGAGALGGLIWGVIDRPSILKTAMEADRQLGLHDLLGTAMTLGNQSADGVHPDWAATVLAMAEMRCQSISPSQILFRRLGIRAWSGIGLITALTLTLGVLCSNPQLTEADAAEKSFLSPGELARGIDRNQEPGKSSAGIEFGRGTRRDGSGDSANSDDTNISDQSLIADQLAKNRGTPDANISSSSAAGTGGGIARSPTPQPETSLMHGTTAMNTTSDAGGIVGGGGRSSKSVEPADGSASGAMSGGNSPTHVIEDWSGKENVGHGDNITSNDTAVPDSFRDLVREYFRIENVNIETRNPK